MHIHRFIDPEQRNAAKREVNRSCKALNLSVDTINLRRFAYIVSWMGRETRYRSNGIGALSGTKCSECHSLTETFKAHNQNQYDNYISTGFKGLRRTKLRKNQVLQNDK